MGSTYSKEDVMYHYLLKVLLFPFLFNYTLHSFTTLYAFAFLPFFLPLSSCSYILLLIGSSTAKDLSQWFSHFLAGNMKLAKRRCVRLVFFWLKLCMLSDMEIKSHKYFQYTTKMYAGFIRDVKCLRTSNSILQPLHKPEENTPTFFNWNITTQVYHNWLNEMNQ